MRRFGSRHCECQDGHPAPGDAPQAAATTDTQMPSCVFASQLLGVHSEVWLWRQIVRFRRIVPKVLTWRYVDREAFPLDGIEVCEPPFDFDPKSAWRRRLRNLRGMVSGNVYTHGRAEHRWLRSYFQRAKPSVLLCQFGFVALSLLDVAEEMDIPLVAHFHGRDVASMLRFPPYRRSLVGNLHRFSEIVVVGAHQKQWMLDHGCPPDRLHVIPCGVPSEQFTYRARSASETVRFIAVGRLAKMKGPEYTLRAYALTKRCVPRSSLLMVGDGSMRAELERAAAELGVADSVRFAGSLHPEEVCRELMDCDVFVQHSIVSDNGDCEGCPVSVAEAASTGLPVVATVCPGVVDVVVDGVTGFLGPQRDAEAMAARMIQLAEDPGLRASMGAAGRQRAVSCFDTGKQVHELEEVLIRAGARRRHG